MYDIDHPAWGGRQISAQLKKKGYKIGRRKTRHYVIEMAIDPIYPKSNLSKADCENKKYPYLPRNAQITASN